MVTAAEGEPAAFGGVAPGGASAGIPGVFAGVGVFFPFELLAVFEHEAANSEVINIAIKANGRPILNLFVLIVYQVKDLSYSTNTIFRDRRFLQRLESRLNLGRDALGIKTVLTEQDLLIAVSYDLIRNT